MSFFPAALCVPFAEKDEVAGINAALAPPQRALWSPAMRQWLLQPRSPRRLFKKWLNLCPAPGRTDLAVPYEQKDAAKGLGAQYDGTARVWYVPAGWSLARFAPWAPAALAAQLTASRAMAEAQLVVEIAEQARAEREHAVREQARAELEAEAEG